MRKKNVAATPKPVRLSLAEAVIDLHFRAAEEEAKAREELEYHENKMIEKQTLLTNTGNIKNALGKLVGA